MASLIEKSRVTSNDSLVKRQLEEVCRRIRLSELSGKLLLLAVLVSGYALVMALYDLVIAPRWPDLSGLLHGIAFGLLLLGVGWMSVQTLRAILRPINPYYAALRIEETVPDAKNSLINWLDLHDQTNYPAAFRANLGSYAVKQIKEGDPDRTIDRRGSWILLAVWVVLLFGLLVLVGRGPRQFLSLMHRAFVPFAQAQVVSRTEITLLQPANGDATVSPHTPIHITASITGHVPAINEPRAPLLHYRYQSQDDFLTMPLQEDGNTWTVRLPGDRVRTGFWYKLSAGDAETREHQVTVRSLPQATRFEITYRERPYRKLEPSTTIFPNEFAAFPSILGLRGTEVEVVVHANRKLQQASLELTQGPVKQSLPGQVLATDPQAFRCRFVLEQTGQFKVAFVSPEGEANIDRTSYTIDVRTDQAPLVVLTEPGKDISLPANGSLELVGHAKDDIGVKRVTLQMQAVKNDQRIPLKAKHYRDDVSLQFEDGSFPEVVDYRDLIALNLLRTDKDQPLRLEPGMKLEYHLEAIDNCDYPNKLGNLGKSKVFKVLIAPPDDSEKQKEQRQQAEDRQKKHEKQQDQKQKNQNQENKSSANGANPNEQKQQEDLRNKMKETENKLQKAMSEKEKEEKKEGSGEKQPQPNSSQNPEKKEGSGEKQPQPNSNQNPEKKEGSGEKQPQPNSNQNPEKKEGSGEKQPQPNSNQNPEKKEGSGEKQPQPNSKPGPEKKESGKEEGSKSKTKDGGSDPRGPKEAAGGSKDKGEPKPGQDRKEGQAKGDESKPQKPAENKNGTSESKDVPTAQAKQNQPKDDGSNHAGTEGQKNKTSEQQANGNEASQNKEPKHRREPTWDEIAKLRDKMKEKQGLGDSAKELAEIAKQANDPKKRDAARDALTSADRDPETGKPKDESQGTVGQSAKNEKGIEEKKGESPGGQSAKNNSGLTDDPTKSDPLSKGRNLQLENLKNITPDMLKRANISDDEWQRYLQQARAYDELLQKSQSPKLDPRTGDRQGQTGLTPRIRPSLINRPGTGNEALDPARGLPPPELRDAQMRFSKTPRE